MPNALPVTVMAQSENRKIGDVATTYTSLHTCPSSCPMKQSGAPLSLLSGKELPMAKPNKLPPPGKEWRLEEEYFLPLISLRVEERLVGKLATGDLTVEAFLSQRLLNALRSLAIRLDCLPPAEPADDTDEHLAIRYDWRSNNFFKAGYEVEIGRRRMKWKLLKIRDE